MGDIMKYDKIINVAIGKSRKELNYVNLELPYSEFIDKYIKNTKYTNETFNVNKEDKILSLTNYSHDMSVYDILGILSAGGEIVLPEAERVKDPEHWLELIEKHGVTLWNTVPAMMEMMLEIMDMKNEGDISSIRVTIFGGDVLKPAMVKKLRERIKNAKIMNVGGPSETTIWNISL